MRNCVLGLIAFLVCGAAHAGGSCREVIVSNEASGDIAIVDPRAAKVLATIPVGTRPRGMALSPDRERLFVALGGSLPASSDNPSAGGIGVVDLNTRQLVTIIKGVSNPERVAVSRDGKRLFVASERRGLMVMLDADTGALLARTPVGAATRGMNLSRSGMHVYATSEAENSVAVLDSRSAALLARVSVGPRPRSTSFSPDGLRAYVANDGAGNISVIDTAALRVLRRIALPEDLTPIRIAVPPDGSPLYVSTGRNREILAIDDRSGRVTARAKTGGEPRGLAMDPDGSELYVANGSSNGMAVFALPKLKMRVRIPTGEKPWDVVCRDNWWAQEGLGQQIKAAR